MVGECGEEAGSRELSRELLLAPVRMMRSWGGGGKAGRRQKEEHPKEMCSRGRRAS